MAQRNSRTPLYIGLAAAGGVGYYLYSAGGSPKVAEKQFESMLSFPFLPHCVPPFNIATNFPSCQVIQTSSSHDTTLPRVKQ